MCYFIFKYFYCQKCLFDNQKHSWKWILNIYICKILLFIQKTLKVKPKNPLALARGVRLPEEVATACLALSLGKRNLPPHHHLPDSSFLLILQRQEEHLPLCSHHLGHNLQQDQESQILQKENPCKAVAPTIVKVESEVLTLSSMGSAARYSVGVVLRGVLLTSIIIRKENEAMTSSCTWEHIISTSGVSLLNSKCVSWTPAVWSDVVGSYMVFIFNPPQAGDNRRMPLVDEEEWGGVGSWLGLDRVDSIKTCKNM